MSENKPNVVKAAIDAAHAERERIQDQASTVVDDVKEMAATVLERLRAKKQEKREKHLRLLPGIAALAILFVLSLPFPSLADDTDGALIDGGSIVTSTDGGSTVVAQLREAQGWTMATRCEGVQATRYVLCTTSSCSAAVDSQMLDYDVTMDIGVNRQTPYSTPKKYIALRTDDGGVPRCLVHVNR